MTTLNSSVIFFYILPCQLVLVKYKMDFWFILMVSLLTLFCPYQFKLIIYTYIVPYWIVFVLCYNKNVKIWKSIVNWYQNKRCLSRCLINAHIWGLSFLRVLIQTNSPAKQKWHTVWTEAQLMNGKLSPTTRLSTWN